MNRALEVEFLQESEADVFACVAALLATGDTFVTRCQPSAATAAPISTAPNAIHPAIRPLKRHRSGTVTVADSEMPWGRTASR